MGRLNPFWPNIDSPPLAAQFYSLHALSRFPLRTRVWTHLSSPPPALGCQTQPARNPRGLNGLAGISGPLQSPGPCGLYGGRDPRPDRHRSATRSRPSRSTTGLWAGAERPRLDNSPLVGLLRRRRIGLGWGASRERGRGTHGRGGDRESQDFVAVDSVPPSVRDSLAPEISARRFTV